MPLPHPTALIAPEAEIDPSAEVGAYVVVEGHVRIGAGCRICPHAQLIGDVQIGEGTTVGRGAVIGEAPQDTSYTPNIRSGVKIGSNNLIREHVTIHRSSKEGGVTKVGNGNFLMVGAHVGHDVTVGDNCVIANAVLLAGHVRIGSNSFLGGGAVFHQFIRVGDYCVIQGNASISQDIPHFCAAHLLNRITGLNVIGLRRNGFAAPDRAAVKDAFDLVFRRGHNLKQALTVARQRTWPAPAEKFLQFLGEPSKKGVCRMRPGERKDNDGSE